MTRKLAPIAFLACSLAGTARASQLITNGGFETNGLAGWTVTTELGSFTGTGFYADTLTVTPESGTTTVGAESGKDYAVSDNAGGSGTAILSQTFIVPAGLSSVILSYGLFVNSYGGDIVNAAAGLDYSKGADQYGGVSLLSAGTSLFSTSAGVLTNFYQGTDSSATNPNAYTNYSYNITPLVGAGGTFILRFAEVNNQDILNLGVDNVSILTSTAAAPEPASVVLLFAAMGGVWLAIRLKPTPPASSPAE
jgi:hypothetical protein